MKMKKLSRQMLVDLELKNSARKLAGIKEIAVKVRRCFNCGDLFETIGSRFCDDCWMTNKKANG